MKRLIILLAITLMPSMAFADGWQSHVRVILQKTDCSGVVNEGWLCWDTDNDTLYSGNGSSATAVGLSGGGTMTGTLTFDGVATDITTGTNEELEVVANGTGDFNFQTDADTTFQVGDGTYSWGHTPEFGVEGVAEFNANVYADTDIIVGDNSDLTIDGGGRRIYSVSNQPLELNDTVWSASIPRVSLSFAAGTHTINDADAAGTPTGLELIPVFNIEDDADNNHPYNAFRINVTETSVDADVENLLINAQVGGTSKFKVDNGGDIYSTGSVQARMEVTAADADGETIATADLNTVRISSGAGDWDLPADSCDSATGNWLTVVANAAHVASITSLDTSDVFVLTDGTALTAGDELDTAGSAWDSCTVLCVATNTWLVTGERGTCADGGVAD